MVTIEGIIFFKKSIIIMLFRVNPFILHTFRNATSVCFQQ